jgi:hypothetical protein
MQIALLIFSVAFIFLIVYGALKKPASQKQPEPDTQRQLLEKHVLFYRELSAEQKLRFERKLRSFLEKVKITGVKTKVEDMDRVLIASAAIIPIFAFKDWEYRNINEVLLYPDSFTPDFKTEGHGRDTLGMVGTGAMNHIMILSQQELRNDFSDHNDKSNTAIHEFVHLIDKADGDTDGLPDALLSHIYSKPWLELMHEEIQEIRKGRSDINPYGATNKAEFFAVVSEYFFKQPERMEEKHPELYAMLAKMFLPEER